MNLSPIHLPREQKPLIDALEARRKLQSATSLHFYHWAILAASLLLSVIAWRFAEATLDKEMKARFTRESIHTVELIKERMLKYEDALLGGVALVNANRSCGNVCLEKWEQYAGSISIDHKYPGINGIGIIHRVPADSIDEYLTEQRQERADFKVHPWKERPVYYPITYITPLTGNETAVGLDMAHEENRFTASKLARDSGLPQITGPISLVQDKGKTPGFLFFAPFYANPEIETIDKRRQQFSGLVYAPFIVKKLMMGTLEKKRRHVGIRLLDGDVTIYDEHSADEWDFDPDPLYKYSTCVNLYGRMWTFDIWSTKSFREALSSSQPLMILIGGILIDCLLLVLFLSISHSSRKALGYADSMTFQLEQKSKELQAAQELTEKRARQLETSNAELEQFACVASHDLQEPLRKVASYCELIGEEYGDQIDDEGKQFIEFAIDGATRMKTLIQDLLNFSKINSFEKAETQQLISTTDCCHAAILNLQSAVDESNAIIEIGKLPNIFTNSRYFTQLLQNLIGNSIKYRSEIPPHIKIECKSTGGEWTFSVVDNGIGIEPEYHKRVFGIFKRLHNRQAYDGNGIGLAICQRIVERWDGRIWVAPNHADGCRICFTVPKRKSNHPAISKGAKIAFATTS